jgi:hypothetical protein
VLHGNRTSRFYPRQERKQSRHRERGHVVNMRHLGVDTIAAIRVVWNYRSKNVYLKCSLHNPCGFPNLVPSTTFNCALFAGTHACAELDSARSRTTCFLVPKAFGTKGGKNALYLTRNPDSRTFFVLSPATAPKNPRSAFVIPNAFMELSEYGDVSSETIPPTAVGTGAQPGGSQSGPFEMNSLKWIVGRVRLQCRS